MLTANLLRLARQVAAARTFTEVVDHARVASTSTFPAPLMNKIPEVLVGQTQSEAGRGIQQRSEHCFDGFQGPGKSTRPKHFFVLPMADEFVARIWDLHAQVETLKELLLGPLDSGAAAASAGDASAQDATLHMQCALSHRRALQDLKPTVPLLAPAYASDLLRIDVEHEHDHVWATFPNFRMRLATEPRPSRRVCVKTVRARDWLLCLVERARFTWPYTLELLDLRTGQWHTPDIEFVADAAALRASNLVGLVVPRVMATEHKEDAIFCAVLDLDLDSFQPTWHPVMQDQDVPTWGRPFIAAFEDGFWVVDAAQDQALLEVVRLDRTGQVQARETLTLTLDFPLEHPIFELKVWREKLCAVIHGPVPFCLALRTSEVLVKEPGALLGFGDSELCKASADGLAVFREDRFGSPNVLVDLSLF
jgi:hypothetical protein